MDGDNVELNSETGNLTIDGLSYDYTGNYTCVAMTGAGTDNLTHTVTVSGEHLRSWVSAFGVDLPLPIAPPLSSYLSIPFSPLSPSFSRVATGIHICMGEKLLK